MELFVLDWNTWNHLTVCKKKNAQSCLKILSIICVYKSYILGFDIK